MLGDHFCQVVLHLDYGALGSYRTLTGNGQVRSGLLRALMLGEIAVSDKTRSGLVNLTPPRQRAPPLHEFLNQPWGRQSHHVPAGIVRSLVKRLQFTP